MNKETIKRSLFCLLAAVVWGISFVSQRSAMEQDMGPFTFNGIRMLLGSLVLIPFIFIIRAKGEYKTFDLTKKKEYNKNTIIGGLLCGIVLCIATNLQQFGIVDMEAGKTGFITALYIVLVPIAGIFLKKKPSILLAISVPLAVAGLYLLCMVGTKFTFGIPELLVFMCAIVFTVHIFIIDYFAPKADGVAMSCIQFAFVGVVSSILMFIFEDPQISLIKECWLEIAYAGVMSCGVAYTFQILGQKNLNPTVASLILSLESCVSVLSGWIILNEQLSVYQIFGCVLMFIAIILAQIPLKLKKKKKLSQDESSNNS